MLIEFVPDNFPKHLILVPRISCIVLPSWILHLVWKVLLHNNVPGLVALL